MRIAPGQKALLNSFSCVRLSSSDAHRELVNNFENHKNPNLIYTLRKDAWDEDSEGSVAYYLVKDSDGFPMFFFSLKCGALYQQLDESQILARKKQLLGALGIVKQADGTFSESDLQRAALILEQYRSGQYKPDGTIDELLDKVDLLEGVDMDKNTDTNRHIIRVDSTHSGIELVHLCKNDLAKDRWMAYGLPQPLGKVIFWCFIVPKIEKILEIVGCKYLFLFAADGSEDGDLINYYNIELKMSRPDDIGTSKPIYDLLCVFMCEKVTDLLSNRDTFMEEFNPDPSELIV